MKYRVLSFVLLYCAAPWCFAPCHAQDAEHPQIVRSSKVYENGFDAAVKIILQSNFDSVLVSPSFGSMSQSKFAALLGEIKTYPRIAGLSLGDAHTTYDVILQPGHYLRTTRRTGATGVLVTEQQLVAYITGSVAAVLRKDGLNVLVVSADDYTRPHPSAVKFDGLQAKAFLAIHTDGTEHKCSAPQVSHTKVIPLLFAWST